MVKGPTKGARSERKGTLGNHSYIHKDARGSFPIWRSHDAQRHKHQKDPLVGFPLFPDTCVIVGPNIPDVFGWNLNNLNNYQILMNFGFSIRSFAFQRIESGPLWTQLFLLDLARWRLRKAYTHTQDLVDGGFGVKATYTRHTYRYIHTHIHTDTHTHKNWRTMGFGWRPGLHTSKATFGLSSTLPASWLKMVKVVNNYSSTKIQKSLCQEKFLTLLKHGHT